jgi:hypothetical protein
VLIPASFFLKRDICITCLVTLLMY